jgi:hypothetical protein
MIETLGVIASIVGIGGAFWALTRYILRHRIEKEERYGNILTLIGEHYAKWENDSYESPNGSLISLEQFGEINRFRDRLKKLDEQKRAFLLRCGVQHGMAGEWGDWLLLNKQNAQTSRALIRALKGEGGWRPIWRSAYILEARFGQNMDSLLDKLSREEKNNENIMSAVAVISEQGVEDYLQSISSGGIPSLKKKAEAVLAEIKCFSAQMSEYAQHILESEGKAAAEPGQRL